MTLPSRKKHQTTQPSTRRQSITDATQRGSKHIGSATGTVWRLLDTVQTAPFDGDAGDRPSLMLRPTIPPSNCQRRLLFCNRPGISRGMLLAGLVCLIVAQGTIQAQESPIQRLRKRSADQRWRAAKNFWSQSGRQEQAPAVPQAPPATLPDASVAAQPSESTQHREPNAASMPFANENRPLAPFQLYGQEAAAATDSADRSTQTGPAKAPQVPPASLPTTSATDSAFDTATVAEDSKADDQAGSFSEQITPWKAGQQTASLDNSTFGDRDAVKDLGPLTTVPNPYAIADTQQAPGANSTVDLPPLPDNPNAKPEVTSPLNELPASPQRRQQTPMLRSISDIQPYHDYNPIPSESQPAFAAGSVDINSNYPDLPTHGSLEREFMPTHYHWVAANLTHNPLYFEDVALERYGHTHGACVQPFVSVGKFGLQFIGLPYQMAMNPVCEDQYPLGYYRPGDCAPPLRYRIPLHKGAAVTAAAAYTGLFFLFP